MFNFIKQLFGFGSVFVFITQNGTKYHKASCETLSMTAPEKRIKVTLNRAREMDRYPCNVCEPQE